MVKKICALSQKGGVGKSTIIRLIATAFARANWRVKIADMDIKQGTCLDWQLRRQKRAVNPVISVEAARSVGQVARYERAYDIILYDSPPHSSALTLDIARLCNAIFLPTGLNLDDLNPSILLAHELIDAGIPDAKIAFVLCRAGSSATEEAEARTYIIAAGYTTLPHALYEKTGYRLASDEGKSPIEAAHPSLKSKAELVGQDIINFITHQKN